MKKARRTCSIILPIILAMIMLSTSACGGDTPAADATATTPVVKAEPTTAPTEAPAEPTIAPTEAVVEVTPTEASVDVDRNIIDGVDFTEFVNGQQGLEELFYTMNYDEMRIIPVWNTAEAILKDGDKFTMVKGEYVEYGLPSGYYILSIYSPKKIKRVMQHSENCMDGNVDGKYEKEEYYDHLSKALIVFEDVVGTDMEVYVKVMYEDGTEETITVYITKDYVVEY